MATIFCDIDGTLFYQPNVIPYPKGASLLKGVRERTYEWVHKGFTVILTTGRKESERFRTVEQLRELGIVYDKLIMGLGTGPRILINDMKGEKKRAFSINVERNKGLENVDVIDMIKNDI